MNDELRKQETDKNDVPKSYMFCPYCGVEIGGDFVYCACCGRRLPFRGKAMPDAKPASREVVVPAGAGSPPLVDEEPPVNRLEAEFRALVKRLPSEALSHFKCADRDVWRVVKAGLPEEDVLRRHGLVGPYEVKICGVLYHAYANEERLSASQLKFLRVWSGGAKKGIRRSRRALAAMQQDAPRRFVAVVTFFVVLIGCILSAFFLASRWGGSF